jgi:hypothetical protein
MVVARKDDFIEANIDDEIVALNIERGICYGLNSVASCIWNRLATPTRVSDLCAWLLTAYKVDSEICEREVLNLLEGLRDEGLIQTLEEQ